MIWRGSSSFSLLLMENFYIGATLYKQEIKPNEWIDFIVKLLDLTFAFELFFFVQERNWVNEYVKKNQLLNLLSWTNNC